MLTNAEIDQIREIIREELDVFLKSPMLYHRPGKAAQLPQMFNEAEEE